MQNKPVTHQLLLASLRREILHGDRVPGSLMPSERSLVQETGLSRSTVREVIKALELDGLISTRQGGRSICNNLLSGRVEMPLDGAGDRLEFQLQVMEVRADLEGEAAYFAALRATDQQLAAIEEEYLRMQQRNRGETTLEKAKADLNFHMLIAESCHHLLVTSFSQLFYARYFNAIYGVLHRTLSKFGRYPDGIRQQHEHIFQALQRRDAEEARAVAREHILYTRRLLEETE